MKPILYNLSLRVSSTFRPEMHVPCANNMQRLATGPVSNRAKYTLKVHQFDVDRLMVLLWLQ